MYMKSLARSIAVLSLLACGSGSNSSSKVNRDTLTERQQDSILAKSSIPGASAVDKAMKAADTTSSRVRGSDSVQ
jgi:hypothetical protein